MYIYVCRCGVLRFIGDAEYVPKVNNRSLTKVKLRVTLEKGTLILYGELRTGPPACLSSI